MQVSRVFDFSAAHILDVEGPCSNLHGHNYKLQVTIEGEVLENGFVMDFADIKKIVKKEVISVLDHSNLNDFIKQPTAEHIVIWIWQKLESKLPLFELTLFETDDTFVSYKGCRAGSPNTLK